MVRHYELTDGQYGLIEDLLPRNGRRGCEWKNHRATLNGILWILHTGAQWRELPPSTAGSAAGDDTARSIASSIACA